MSADVLINLADAQRRQPGAGVPSPCVSVCQMDPVSGLCRGCWRTLDEIAGWSGMTDPVRLGVWQDIEKRQTGSGTT